MTYKSGLARIITIPKVFGIQQNKFFSFVAIKIDTIVAIRDLGLSCLSRLQSHESIDLVHS
jgi:hypothetical protein